MKKENITYPMNALQWETYEEWNQDREMTEYNTTVAMDALRENISADRMAQACQHVLDSQRYLHAHLTEQEGEILICEDPTMPNHVWRHEMTDEEWEQRQEELIRPFHLFEEPSARLHVVATETRTILVVETHHLLFDGIAHKALWFAVRDVLHGHEPCQQGDAARDFNLQETAAYGSEAYLRAQQYYKEALAGIHFTDICRDSDTPWGRTIVARPHFPASVIDAGCKRLGLSFAVIFNAAYALALSRMSGEQKVVFYNISHGRNRKLNENIYGNFLSCLPILIDTDKQQTVKALLAQTKSQMFISMRNKVYPLYHMIRDLGLDDTGTEMSPQGAYICEFMTIDGIEYPSYHIETDLSLQHLSTCILIRGDEYEVALDGSDALYTQEQLDTLARLTGEYAIKLTTSDETDSISGLR